METFYAGRTTTILNPTSDAVEIQWRVFWRPLKSKQYFPYTDKWKLSSIPECYRGVMNNITVEFPTLIRWWTPEKTRLSHIEISGNVSFGSITFHFRLKYRNCLILFKSILCSRSLVLVMLLHWERNCLEVTLKLRKYYHKCTVGE